MRIVTLGDLLLDVIVRPAEPLTQGADAIAETITSPGGQAANVAAWAVELGGEGRVVAKVGSDPAGTLVVDAVEAQGVEAPGPRTGDRTGVVVSIVSPDGDRTMASDRGSARELEADELTEAWFADCDWLHVTAYAVMSSPIDVAVDRATAFARRHGAQVSLDLSAWTRIRDYGPSRFGERVERLAPDVVFGTEREWEVVDGHVRPPTMVTKRGARGVRVRAGGENRDLPAVEGPVVDSTGAGDAFAAGYLVGGVEAGLEAASRCVGKPGAMP